MNNAKSSQLHWSVSAFFALYITLPSYFAIELHQKLPLITISRLLLVFMGIVLFVQKKDLFRPGNIRQGKLNLLLTKDKPLRICLLVYFGILILVNATFLFETSEAVKQLFVILAEEYLLVWMLTLILDSRQKIVSALKALLIGSAFSGIVACFSVIFHKNIFIYLNTVSRDILNDSYRYGMLRPAAGFSHAVYYGAYCAVMLPLSMYLVEHTENKKERKLYAVCTALTLAGLIMANSRGSQLAFVCVAGLIFFIRLYQKNLKALFRTYLPIILVSALIVAVVFSLSPAGRYRIGSFFSKLFPSLSTPPLPVDPDSGNTGLDLSFGENPDGIKSRLIQLTGIVYTMGLSPVFGLGPNAHARGLVGYKFIETKWSFVKTVDINITAIICQYGLVGFLGFLSLYGGLGITFLRKKFRKDPLMHHLLLSYICYMLCLLSISFLDKWFWVFTGITLALVNVISKEEAAS